MSGDALGSAFRDASGRIVAALATRFRNLDLAEDAFADACARALEAWAREGPPRDAAAWLYRTAYRCAVDILRRCRTEQRFAPDLQHDAITEQPMAEIEALAPRGVDDFLPYHAVRADLLRKAGRHAEARDAYDAALALVATSAERLWLQRQRAALTA